MIEVKNIQDFSDYLDTLLNQTECDDIEFKSAAGGFPGSFWETYSAFANTDGGTIVFGVKENNGKLSLNGLTEEQIEKYKKDFWNNVNNRSTISYNLMNEQGVCDAEYKGYKFLLFFVPRASKEQRPVFKTTDPYHGTYKRNFEGDNFTLLNMENPERKVASSERKVASSQKTRLPYTKLRNQICTICSDWVDLMDNTKPKIRGSEASLINK